MILLRVIKRVAGMNNIIINNPSSIRKALPLSPGGVRGGEEPICPPSVPRRGMTGRCPKGREGLIKQIS